MASRYYDPVYKQKRDALINRLSEVFSKLFTLQMNRVREDVIVQFSKDMEKLTEMKEVIKHFKAKVDEIMERSIQHLRQVAECIVFLFQSIHFISISFFLSFF
jgi:uncharacterized protein (UPF0305 family)